MGQYHKFANLDKMEILLPHKFGQGLKQREMCWPSSAPGIGQALIALLASASTGVGGGDFDKEEPTAVDVLGRWRGDRIVQVGDYDESVTYQTRCGPMTGADIYNGEDLPSPLHWVDISDQVCAWLEVEFNGTYDGEGWREWRSNEKPQVKQAG